MSRILPISFPIDKQEELEKFKKICRDKGLNRSAIIVKLIEEFNHGSKPSEKS